MPQTEVTGANIVAFLTSAGEVSPVFEKKARETFEKYGITDPEESDWYDSENYTEAMLEIVDKAGEKTVQQAGRESVRFNEPLLEQDDTESALAVLSEQHVQTHRDYDESEVGAVECEMIGDTRCRVTGTGGYKYPESLLRGAAKETVLQTGEVDTVEITDADTEDGEVMAFELVW